MYLVGYCLNKLNFVVISFQCHFSVIPEYTTLLNILNFLIGMFMYTFPIAKVH